MKWSQSDASLLRSFISPHDSILSHKESRSPFASRRFAMHRLRFEQCAERIQEEPSRKRVVLETEPVRAMGDVVRSC